MVNSAYYHDGMAHFFLLEASIMPGSGKFEVLGPVSKMQAEYCKVAYGESAWIIAADIAALLPLIGAVKYADELSIIAKNSDELSNGIKYSDEAASVAKRSNNIHWGKWEDYKKVRVNGKEYAQIGDYKYTEHAVSEFLNPSIQTNQIKGVEHSRGVPPSYVNWILTEGRKLGTTKIVEERIVNGAKRVTYANGTLCVSVENGDTVITIFTK